MRRFSFLSSGVVHVAAVTAFVIGVPWQLQESERDYEIRVDHRQAAIAARPLPQPEQRPAPAPSVLDMQERLVVTPEVERTEPRPEDTFGLPLEREAEPSDDEERAHRTASDDRSVDFHRPISERIVFEDVADDSESETDTAETESTEESETPEEQASNATSTPRSGARARLSGRVRAPDYPDRAIRMRWEGDVVIEFAVGADGRVADAQAVDDLSCRFGLLKIEAAKAVKTWRFNPATENGRAIASRLRVRIRFRLRGGVGVDIDEWSDDSEQRDEGGTTRP
ncbi:MAG: TonB family protein [Planctomycetota bacterium]